MAVARRTMPPPMTAASYAGAATAGWLGYAFGEPAREPRRRPAPELGVQTEDLERLLQGARRLGQGVGGEERPHLTGRTRLAQRRQGLEQAREHQRRNAATERRPAAGEELPRGAPPGRVAEEPHEDEGHILRRDVGRQRR